MNIGFTDRLSDEKCAIEKRTSYSKDLLNYKLDTNRNMNCGKCYSSNGPRNGTYGVSHYALDHVAPSQQLVELESKLSMRNASWSKCQDGYVNSFDINSMTMPNASQCSSENDTLVSQLETPITGYRELAVNRFYNLQRNPQLNVGRTIGMNSQLNARDNYIPKMPNVQTGTKFNPTPKDMDTCSYNVQTNFNAPC